MTETEKVKWPDEVRLKMIERSEFYAEPRIYQYGYYDGYQQAIEGVEKMKSTLTACKAFLSLLELDGFEHKALYDKIEEALVGINLTDKLEFPNGFNPWGQTV